jgi:hypothetical protein
MRGTNIQGAIEMVVGQSPAPHIKQSPQNQICHSMKIFTHFPVFK